MHRDKVALTPCVFFRKVGLEHNKRIPICINAQISASLTLVWIGKIRIADGQPTIIRIGNDGKSIPIFRISEHDNGNSVPHLKIKVIVRSEEHTSELQS